MALVAGLVLLVAWPVWEALDPQVLATVSYCERGARADPWGSTFKEHQLGGRHSFTYSLGPNCIDDSEAFFAQLAQNVPQPRYRTGGWLRGDDFAVAGGHALDYEPGPRLIAVRRWGRDTPIVVLVLSVLFLAVRQVHAPVVANVGIEALRSCLIAAPVAGLAALGVVVAGVEPPAGTEPIRIVSWPASVFATALLVVTIALLSWRTRRKGDAS